MQIIAMKVSLYFSCLTCIMVPLLSGHSLALNQKNIETITFFVKKIQVERKIPCIIHFIDENWKLPILQHDEKFQFYYFTTPHGKPILSECSILIANASFFASQPDIAEKMEKSMNNLIWIIVGKYDIKRSVHFWPVLEVQPRISKLHCPEDSTAKIITQSKISTCPEYPTWNEKNVSVGVTGISASYRVLPNGRIIGYFPESVSLFSDHIGFKPNYIVEKNWDAMVFKVHNGTYDIGVLTTKSPERFQIIDSPGVIDFMEVAYMIEVPKPADVLYQLLQPFTMNVWLIWVSLIATFCILCYSVIKLLELPIAKSKIDIFLHVYGITIQPLTSTTPWIKALQSNTISGGLVMGSLITGGFIIMTVWYKNVLLSHLTAIEYEKPIETAKELAESDLITYTYNDKRFLENMKNSATFKDLYRKVIDNGWIVDGTNHTVWYNAISKGQDAGAISISGYNYMVSRQIQRLNKKLFLMSKDRVFSYPRSLVLPKNGPMTATFTKFISRAFDTGLFHKIKYQYQLRDGKCTF